MAYTCCRSITISPGGSTLGVFIIWGGGGEGAYDLVVEKSLRYRHFGTAVLTYHNSSRYVLLMKSTFNFGHGRCVTKLKVDFIRDTCHLLWTWKMLDSK